MRRRTSRDLTVENGDVSHQHPAEPHQTSESKLSGTFGGHGPALDVCFATAHRAISLRRCRTGTISSEAADLPELREETLVFNTSCWEAGSLSRYPHKWQTLHRASSRSRTAEIMGPTFAEGE